MKNKKVFLFHFVLFFKSSEKSIKVCNFGGHPNLRRGGLQYVGLYVFLLFVLILMKTVLIYFGRSPF